MPTARKALRSASHTGSTSSNTSIGREATDVHDRTAWPTTVRNPHHDLRNETPGALSGAIVPGVSRYPTKLRSA